LLATILAEKRQSESSGLIEHHEVSHALQSVLGSQEAELVQAAGKWSEPARVPKGQRAWAADEQDFSKEGPMQAQSEEEKAYLAGYVDVAGGWKCSPDHTWAYHPSSRTWLERATSKCYRRGGEDRELEEVGDAEQEKAAVAAEAFQWEPPLKETAACRRQQHGPTKALEKQLKTHKVPALREECKKWGLITLGKKADLVARLVRRAAELEANDRVQEEGFEDDEDDEDGYPDEEEAGTA